MFKTRYDSHDRTETPIGDRIAPIYSLTENGDLKQSGEMDLYAEIQSHAESCDIELMLARLELGDSSMLRTGQYIDVSDMPKTLAEAYTLIRNAENDFNSLPLDIRKEYDFNYEEYIKDLGSEKWRKLLIKEEVIPEENIEEVKPGEQK